MTRRTKENQISKSTSSSKYFKRSFVLLLLYKEKHTFVQDNQQCFHFHKDLNSSHTFSLPPISLKKKIIMKCNTGNKKSLQKLLQRLNSPKYIEARRMWGLHLWTQVGIWRNMWCIDFVQSLHLILLSGSRKQSQT